MKITGLPILKHFKASLLSAIYGISLPDAKILKQTLEINVEDDVGKKLIREGMAIEKPISLKPTMKKSEGGK